MVPLPGDILVVRGTGWISKGILKATGNTVSHVGIVTAISPFVEITEALTRVRTRPMEESIAEADWAAILQDKTLTDEERTHIVISALKFSAAGYNYLDILFQLLNANFSTTWFTDHLAFRMDNTPICSYVAAKTYSDTGRNFGVPDKTTTPADIYAFSIHNSDKYTELVVKHNPIFG